MYYSVGNMCERQVRYESEINIHIFTLAPFVYVHIETRTAGRALARLHFYAVDAYHTSVRLDAHLFGDVEMKTEDIAVFEHHFEREAEIMVAA